MSTSNARNLFGPAQTRDPISSPPHNHQRTSATEQRQMSAATRYPPHIEGPSLALTHAPDNDTRGNRRYELMMRDAGYLGHFLLLDRKASELTAITLDCTAIRNGITLVLTAALECALHKRGKISQADISSSALKTAQTLTAGCMMALYCRLRTVNKCNYGTYKTFLHRPHSGEDFEIPTPYALAFQYLGIFRVENMTKELELIPTVSATDASTFCVGSQLCSPTAYKTAVEFAKNLGISFHKVDLTMKLGSAWWLLKSDNNTEVYQLLACLPESNYTPEDAVIRALWCVTDAGTFHTDIADLSSLMMDRGSFLHAPPPDIALTCFHGLMESPEEDVYAIS